MKILIVDDEMPTRMIMKRYLQKLKAADESPLDIDEAENGKIAVEKILSSNNGFHLITLDWNMPTMDGFEVLTELKRQGIKSPIMMISAKTDQDEIDKTLAEGASAYIIKPFSLDQLKEKANDILKSFDHSLFA